MTVTLYGIKNCDTVKKAKTWLEENAVAYHFHDVRKDGLSEAILHGWVEQLGFDVLLNRRGTTWRKLSEAEKNLDSEEVAIILMLEYTALIKRPVMDVEGKFHVGFDAAEYAAVFDISKA